MSSLSDEDHEGALVFEEKVAQRLILASLVSSPFRLFDTSQRVAKFFARNKTPHDFSGTEQDFIQVAQILVDHTVTSSPACGTSDDPEHETKLDNTYLNNFDNQALSKICRKLFRDGRTCTLRDVAVQLRTEVANEAATVLQREPNLLRLEPPLITVRRSGSKMNMLPPALAFWEELGLAPISGSKDVTTFCIPPKTKDYLGPPIERFVRSMRDAYHSCNLGSHEIFEDSTGTYKATYHESFGRFGNELAKLAHINSTIVVYLVNQDLDTATPPDLCSGSLSILDGYQRGIRSRNLAHSADLVVQIVSQRFVFSSDHPIVLPMSTYKRIAFEVYDRCGPPEGATGSRLPYISAPATHLSRPIPPKIDFQLSADPLSASLYHDDRVHLAYAWKPSSAWLTVSWTDNVGILQWNAAYWVGQDDEQPWRPFKEVVTEILGTTLDMLQPRSRKWKVFVVRETRYLIEELAGEPIQALYAIRHA